MARSETPVVVNPRFHLVHPSGARRYEFAVCGLSDVRVRKFHGADVVEQKDANLPAARSLFAWLLKLGYTLEAQVRYVRTNGAESNRGEARLI